MKNLSRSNSFSTLEVLEARIAPAAIATFTDVDGDIVTVKTSKGSNADLAAAGVINKTTFSFAVTGGVAITSINLGGNAVFAGTDLAVTAKPGPLGGNGLVNVTSIQAVGVDLGTVTVKGDLQEIDAGKSGDKIAAINVYSTSGIQVSTIAGSVGTFSVKNDLRGAEIHLDDAGATLGLLKIGGSLIGEVSSKTGYFSVVAGTIKKISIGGDIQGGSSNVMAGVITARDIVTATVGGSILGGAGADSGKITVSNSLGSLVVKGSVIGGTNTNSGLVHGDATLGNITILGSLIGGTMGHSGTIEGATGIGRVKIGRDQKGGAANDTGDIESSGGGILAVTVGGSVLGGSASFSGRIVATGGNLGPVKIGGDLVATTRDSGGNLLQDTGIVFAVIGTTADATKSNIASLTVGGSIVGGGSDTLFRVAADGTIGAVKIGRDIRGGAANGSGGILGFSGITSVSVGGSLIGGAGLQSGIIQATSGMLGSVKIGGSVLGGTNGLTGEIAALANVGNITIGGDLKAGSVTSAGVISVTGTAGAIKIGGSIVGTVNASAGISVVPPTGTALAIKSLTVGGRVEFANIDAGGATNADAQIGAVKVGGDWIASNLTTGIDDGADNLFGTADDAAVAGGNPLVFSKIASITIGGQVSGTNGNTDHFGFVSQEIGSLKINGVKVPLTPGHGTDLDSTKTQFTLGVTSSMLNNVAVRDVTVHEVA